MTDPKFKVEIESIDASDTKAIKAIQAKVNQWITKGEFAKLGTHTTATHVIFTICRLKSEDSAPNSKTANKELAPF